MRRGRLLLGGSATLVGGGLVAFRLRNQSALDPGYAALPLQGRLAVVTGASSGIGKEVGAPAEMLLRVRADIGRMLMLWRGGAGRSAALPQGLRRRAGVPFATARRAGHRRDTRCSRSRWQWRRRRRAWPIGGAAAGHGRPGVDRGLRPDARGVSTRDRQPLVFATVQPICAGSWEIAGAFSRPLHLLIHNAGALHHTDRRDQQVRG